MPSPSPSTERPAPSRFRRKRVVGILFVIVVFIALAPTVISRTALRDRLINAAISDQALRASTQSASLGYLSPLSVEGFDLRADNGSLRVEMQSLECDKSWLSMLVSRGDLGTFRFRRPTLRVVTGIAPPEDDLDADEPSPVIKVLPTLVAEVIDARVQIRNTGQKNPSIDLQGVDFTIRTEQRDFGSLVQVDPTTILDQQPLTPELCNQGLQLIAPMLAGTVSVHGRVSFRIAQCAIPVGEINKQQRQQLTDIGGTLGLSDVSVGLNSQITAKLLALLKRFGQIKDDIELTVSRTSQVRFHVMDGRVHHQGLMFLLPVGNSDFELTSSGSVGFDETLDLEFMLGLPGGVLGDGALSKFFTSDPLVIQVTGSVKDPQVNLASDKGWTGRLNSVLGAFDSSQAPSSEGQSAEGKDADAENSGAELKESAGAVLDFVGGLLERGKEQDQSPLPGLRERLRDRGETDSESPRRPGLLRRRRQQ